MSHGVFSPGKWLEFTSLVHSGSASPTKPIKNNSNSDPKDTKCEEPPNVDPVKAQKVAAITPPRACSLFSSKYASKS